jgi:hypothetical protein
MTIDKMDLSTIADAELAVMLEAFGTLGQCGNRIGLDLLCVIEKERMARHQHTDIVDYTDNELGSAMVMLTRAVDASRAGGVPDDCPAVQFLLEAITGLAGEVERRGLIKPLQ